MHATEQPEDRMMRRRSLGALAIAALVSACAMPQDPLASALVAPGKYELYDCGQLETAAKYYETTLKKYESLMAKASESAAGGLVNATTYQPDYISARGELNDVHRTASAKGCDAKQEGQKALPKPPPDLTRKR
jgi:hypothetical protein